jgi:excisionase family DNA binding protein
MDTGEPDYDGADDEPVPFGADAGGLLSIRDASRLLGISRRFGEELCARGDLATIRVGRQRLVPRRAVWAFIADAQARTA